MRRDTRFDPTSVEGPYSPWVRNADVSLSSKVSPLTPDAFPQYVAANPRIKVKLRQLAAHNNGVDHTRRQVLYTARYLRKPLSFETMIEQFPADVDLGEVIFKQHRSAYPDKKPVVVDLWDVWQERDYKSRDQRDQSDANAERMYVERFIAPKYKGADTRVGSNTGPADLGVNTYLAYLIHRDHASDPQLTSWDFLKTVATLRRLQLDSAALSGGFVQLVSRRNTEYLASMGLIDIPEGTQKLYEVTSDWLSTTAAAVVRESPESKHFAPYPYELKPDSYPSVDFLPHLARVCVEYLESLPQLIRPGQKFDLAAVQSTISGFYNFSQLVLNENLADPQRKNEAKVREVYDSVMSYRPVFAAIWEIYRRQTTLLDQRIGDEPAVITSIPNYQNLREEILKSGGRAPRLPLWYRVRHGVERGDI